MSWKAFKHLLCSPTLHFMHTLIVFFDNISYETMKVQGLRCEDRRFPVQELAVLHADFPALYKERPPPFLGSHCHPVGIHVLICTINSSHRGVVYSDGVGLVNMKELGFLS